MTIFFEQTTALRVNKNRVIKEKKQGKQTILFFNDTKSHISYFKHGKNIHINTLRSHFTGDANLLAQEVYRRFPNTVIDIEVMRTKERKKALTFWKSQGFKTVNKDKSFYYMERKPVMAKFKITAEEKQIIEKRRIKAKSYPELMKLVDEVYDVTVKLINKKAPKIKSEMPYKAQWVLEELIKKLEEAV